MERATIVNKVTEIVCDILDGMSIESSDFNISDSLDSVKLVSLIVELEDEYGITIEDDDFSLDKFGSVNKITGLLASYLED